jgi:hypothetical protein
MMKSLAIMFFILTVINIPMLLVYSSSTANNNYKFESYYKYFTLGNIAQNAKVCGYAGLQLADVMLATSKETLTSMGKSTPVS